MTPVIRVKFLLVDDFDKEFCVTSRYVVIDGNAENASDSLTIAATKIYLVAGFHDVRRLCRSPIEQDKARVAKLLSYRATRAKAAEFKEEVETH